MKTILLATNNKHKKEKLTWIVKDYFDTISDMPERVEVEENGVTFEENAQIKSAAVAKKFKAYAIATDGGALIPSLGNAWNGLLTRRFLNKTDEVTDWAAIPQPHTANREKTFFHTVTVLFSLKNLTLQTKKYLKTLFLRDDVRQNHHSETSE